MIDRTGSKASVADARPINSSPCPPHASVCTPSTRRPNVLHGTVEPAEVNKTPEGLGAMSPKMACEETEALGREIQAERLWHKKALQDSLLLLTSRIEEVSKEHEKLARNNKLLQEDIGALKDQSSAKTLRTYEQA